jgi:hypothetical protein
MSVHPFPPRRIEPAMSAPVEAPFPRPRVASTDPIPSYAVQPGPVTQLKALAEGKGWLVSVTYSEGYEPHATTGRPSAKVKTKWALRMRRGQERAVAVRTDNAWTSFWHWSPLTTRPVGSGGLGEFEKVL